MVMKNLGTKKNPALSIIFLNLIISITDYWQVHTKHNQLNIHCRTDAYIINISAG